MKNKQNPIKNKETIQQLEKIASNHLIGSKLRFKGDKYLFIFFETCNGLDGIQSRIITTKKDALTLLITRLDEYYNNANKSDIWHRCNFLPNFK